MIRRVLLLAIGGYSPSRVGLMISEQAAKEIAHYFNAGLDEPVPVPVYEPKTWLDRWEWRNYQRASGEKR